MRSRKVSGFDGSSIRGFQEIQESDMLLVPDATTAFDDPFTAAPTLVLLCNVKDPVTGESYSRDPRYIAQKAAAYLKSTGIGDTAYFGPEPEFFILDSVRFSQGYDHGFYYVDSKEGFWNSGKEENPNLGYKPRYKEGYFPVPPMDSQQDIRTEMMLTLESIGVDIEVHHHEVGTAGQAEIDMRFDSLVSMGDKLLKYKYVVKNVARRHGKTATFMPKPIFQDNGSGMHVHQSIWKGDKNTFFEAGTYADLSKTALYYIGGLLKHAPALLALCNPTTNSYRRLVPGYEAPINLIYSQRNRSAAVRIPLYSRSEKSKRAECRFPDPSCNGYLAFSAMLMAGLDGIQNKLTPPGPLDKDLYDLPPEELAKIESTPGSLPEVLDALEPRPRVPAEGRRVHPRCHRDLVGVQAGARGRCHTPAAASLGVCAVFRHLTDLARVAVGTPFRSGCRGRPLRARPPRPVTIDTAKPGRPDA